MSSQRLRLGVNSPVYEANAHNIDDDAVDCGIKAIQCCGSPRCQKLGTTTTFLSVLVLVAIVQGASEKLVSISIQQAALEHDYNPTIIEWLLVTNGIAQGLFAILIAYWGNRIHKTNWLCGLLVFQAVTSVIVIIPTIAHSDDSVETLSTHVVDYLCTNRTFEMLVTELPHSITNLIFLFLLQIGIGCGFVAFYTLGLTYLDDNALQHNSAALIGGAIAGRFIGYQVGYALLIFLIDTTFGWWLGWVVISPLLIILAVIVGLFPMKLIATVVREAAGEIVDTATNNSQMSLSRAKYLSDISFFCSMKRLLTNKVLIFNVLATGFIQTALINYASQEQNYLQSRFLFPADSSGLLNNEWTSRTITKFIIPLLVALSVLVGGLIIAKANPSSRKVAIWNFATALIVCLLFISYIFLRCSHRPLAGAYGTKLTQPFCSRSCLCDSDIQFTPVCPTDGRQTFFSPCHAGCSSEQVINGQRVFGNCSCGIDSEIPTDGSGVFATEGACEYDECQKFWIIFEILTTFGAVCVGSRLVGKILITIRSVLPQDKALALACEVTVACIIAYIPGKIGYEAIGDWLCKYKSNDRSKCFIHDPNDFGDAINIVSAFLCFIAAILEVVVFLFIRDLDLYNANQDETDGVRRYRTEQVHNFQIYSPPDEDTTQEEAQPAQPLLTGLVTSAGLHTIQESQSEYPHQSPAPNESMQRQTPRNGSPSNNSPTRSSPSVETRTVKLVLLKAAPAGTHIEELNVRLQQIKQQGDINPSVGDISDKESDLNIRQLEESVSSLSGIESSQFNSPEANRTPKATINYKSIETDF